MGSRNNLDVDEAPQVSAVQYLVYVFNSVFFVSIFTVYLLEFLQYDTDHL